MEVTKVPDAELKTVIMRILKDLRGRTCDLRENLNEKMVRIKKDTEAIKRNQSEMNNI